MSTKLNKSCYIGCADTVLSSDLLDKVLLSLKVSLYTRVLQDFNPDSNKNLKIMKSSYLLFY